MSKQVVTVDGPSGTGKSTVAREVARRAGLPHLDTGAFYRAATLAVLRARADPDDEQAVTEVVAGLRLDQVEGAMFLNGEDVSVQIRSDEVTAAVSQVSAIPAVREMLVELQRAWVSLHDNAAVVEGRDIGTVVFPDAEVKVYLDASPEIRARRRALQDREDPALVIADLRRRDHLDSTRETSPLKVPAGAHVVDTSDLTFDEVVDEVLSFIEQ